MTVCLFKALDHSRARASCSQTGFLGGHLLSGVALDGRYRFNLPGKTHCTQCHPLGRLALAFKHLAFLAFLGSSRERILPLDSSPPRSAHPPIPAQQSHDNTLGHMTIAVGVRGYKDVPPPGFPTPTLRDGHNDYLHVASS